MARIKKISILLSVMLLSFLLCSCTAKKDIVGCWYSNGKEDVFYNKIEFFSDGSFATEAVSWCGEYSIDDGRLYIKGKLYSETFDIAQQGKNKIVLKNELGYEKTYTRKK